MRQDVLQGCLKGDGMLESVVTVRMDRKLLEEIDQIARKERNDRAAVLRRLISDALDRYRLGQAIKTYKEGRATTEKAAEMAGISVHEMIEMLRQEGIPSQLAVEDIRREAAELLERMGKKQLAERINRI